MCNKQICLLCAMLFASVHHQEEQGRVRLQTVTTAVALHLPIFASVILRCTDLHTVLSFLSSKFYGAQN